MFYREYRYTLYDMNLTIQPYKGARDFYPSDKRLQKYLFGVMRAVCERYGYEEYDAPILEPTELYLQKGNEEIIKEQTYTFEDRGGRSVTLRTEMTPSVSRMVAAKRQELSYPLRWYSIPNCWRYERPQRGRGREFYQLNVDLFGVEGLSADAEIIQVADAIMQAYGAKRDMYVVKVASRVLIDAIMRDYLALDESQTVSMIRLIDKLNKLDADTFRMAAEDIIGSRPDETMRKLVTVLETTQLNDLPALLSHHESVTKLTELLDLLSAAGITNAVFDVSLMRGFDYYTDIVFEVFDTNPENSRSLFGGGRYDGLVASFGVEPVPTVGFGMGDIGLLNFLETHDLVPRLKPEIELYVALIGDNMYHKAMQHISDLREMGVKTYVDISGRKLDRQLKNADKMGAPYVVVVGEDELEREQFKLKHLQSGNEDYHSLQRIVTIIKDIRS